MLPWPNGKGAGLRTQGCGSDSCRECRGKLLLVKFITLRQWFEGRGLKETEGPSGVKLMVDPEMLKDTILLVDVDQYFIGVPDDWPH